GAPLPGRPADADATTTVSEDHDALLERLIDLEQRLADDVSRKPKHQKSHLQAQWREEIAAITARLS
ncbi:ABC transporter ATP-binding protein, partial [Klebsiella pneumoniae]|nr:ABC transporter ATP-binding protein [Klebsiella pneumoniae]